MNGDEGHPTFCVQSSGCSYILKSCIVGRCDAMEGDNSYLMSCPFAGNTESGDYNNLWGRDKAVSGAGM